MYGPPRIARACHEVLAEAVGDQVGEHFGGEAGRGAQVAGPGGHQGAGGRQGIALIPGKVGGVEQAVQAAGGAANLVGAVGPGAGIETDALAAGHGLFGQDLAAGGDRLHGDLVEGRAGARDVGPDDESGRGIVVQGRADFLHARGRGAALQHPGGEDPGTGALFHLHQQRVIACLHIHLDLVFVESERPARTAVEHQRAVQPDAYAFIAADGEQRLAGGAAGNGGIRVGQHVAFQAGPVGEVGGIAPGGDIAPGDGGAARQAVGHFFGRLDGGLAAVLGEPVLFEAAGGEGNIAEHQPVADEALVAARPRHAHLILELRRGGLGLLPENCRGGGE